MPPNENPNDMMKMYIIINRKALSLVQCGVQGAHAAAEFMFYNKDNAAANDWAENHKTMIFLEGTPEQMDAMEDFFSNEKKAYRKFLEPDLGNLKTAVAFEPVSSAYGKIVFGKFKLLS